MSFLQLVNVQKLFGQTVAVDTFNLQIDRGEFITFLGPSGCGKTTTLRMVAGFEKPTVGSIIIDGQDVTHTPANRRHVGMVFQSYALFPNMTVADNIGFGLKIARTPAAEIKKRVAEMLELIHLPGYGQRYPYQLSGGQQQRVALARALAFQPQVLLLDEPLSALDAKIRHELREEIRRIQRELGITTIYVTHDQEEAMAVSDRIVVMNTGKIEQIGSPFEVYNFPKTRFVASFVGMLNQLDCVVANPARGELLYHNQPFATETPLDLPQGAPVRVYLRPEELHLEEGPPNGYNRLTGTIQTITFLGAIVRLGLDIGDGILTVDIQNERHLRLPQTGQPQSVVFPPHACLVMTENGDGAQGK